MLMMGIELATPRLSPIFQAMSQSFKNKHLLLGRYARNTAWEGVEIIDLIALFLIQGYSESQPELCILRTH